MWELAFVLAALTCLKSVADAQRGACTAPAPGLPVVDMCEGGSWTLGRVYISISSTTMGENSRCSCTLRGKTPGQNTATFIALWEQGNSSRQCETGHSTTVAWPPAADRSSGDSFTFVCNMPLSAQVTSPNNTNAVTLTQLRSNSSAVFNYCLFVEPTFWKDNNIELACQSESSSDVSTPTSQNEGMDPPVLPFPTAAVAGGVVGGVALIVIVIVTIVVCARQRK